MLKFVNETKKDFDPNIQKKIRPEESGRRLLTYNCYTVLKKT